MNKKILMLLAFTGVVFASSNSMIESRSDYFAPIGIMEDHLNKKDTFMTSFRYGRNETGDAFSGTSKVSGDQGKFEFSKMTLGGMWGYSDDITFRVDIPYLNTKYSPSVGDSTEVDGIGDVVVGSMINLQSGDKFDWILNAGLSLPVGKIDEKKSGQRLANQLQLGSGTYDIRLGTTVSYLVSDNMSFGSQAMGVFRTGKNDEKYRLGNQLNLSAWGQYAFNQEFSGSLRTSTLFEGNPSNQEGQGRIVTDIGVGLNYTPKNNFLEGNLIAFEYNAPIFRYTQSESLITESALTFGLQRMFN